MSQSSPVWQVFAKAGNQVKCGICHHKLSLQKDGSTSNMKKHIERRHNAKFNDFILLILNLMEQPNILVQEQPAHQHHHFHVK